MQYFKRTEFNCPCCNQNAMNSDFMSRLDEARGYAGIPFIISSGYRCHRHNKKVGGSSTSSHLKGCAVDIKCVDSRSRYLILEALLDAGFSRIGIGKDFIHVDNDLSKSNNVLWIY